MAGFLVCGGKDGLHKLNPFRSLNFVSALIFTALAAMKPCCGKNRTNPNSWIGVEIITLLWQG